MPYLIGLIIFLHFLNISRSCFPNYVPDAKKSDEDIPRLESRSKNVDNCECGIRGPTGTLSSDSKSDIADPEEYPWHVLIERKGHVPKFCGGSVINDLFIITTVTCLVHLENLTIPHNLLRSTHFDPGLITIYTNVKNNEPLDKAKTLTASSIHCHFRALPTYMTTGKLIYDICMIQLSKKLDFTKTHLSPVCIPNIGGLDLVGRKSILLGWSPDISQNSINSKGQTSHSILKLKKSWIYSTSACELDNHRLICTQHGPIKDIFLFENVGSPVMVPLKSGRLLQVGVSSWKNIGNSQGQESVSAEISTNLGANDIIAFINEQSERGKARWCKQPKMEFEAKLNDFVDKPIKSSDHPWEGFPSTYRKTKSSCSCGIRKSLAKSRIVGGHETAIHEYGWQVQLHIQMNAKQTQGCGGSIINSKLILTASHCVATYDESKGTAHSVAPADIKVSILKHSGFNVKDKSQKIMPVAKVFSHPKYKFTGRGIENDIAVLELKEHLDFESEGSSSPVCMPTFEEPEKSWIGKFGTVIGYGLTNEKDKHSTAAKLQELDVPIHDEQKCKAAASVIPFSVPDKIICAGFMKFIDYKDPSHGDSGGPLMIARLDPASKDPNILHMVQIGLVSAGTYDILSLDDNPDASTAVWYSSVPGYISYIDYFSYRAGAEWCSW